MKVAKKSPVSRQTLTLPAPAIRLLDSLRDDTPKSTFLHHLLEGEARRRERRHFYQQAVAAYTPEVCEQTLALNAEYPVHEE
ncbi:MAG: hypothetical protein ACOYMS_10720 [Terrimicrobiaceae bacterium]